MVRVMVRIFWGGPPWGPWIALGWWLGSNSGGPRAALDRALARGRRRLPRRQFDESLTLAVERFVEPVPTLHDGVDVPPVDVWLVSSGNVDPALRIPLRNSMRGGGLEPASSPRTPHEMTELTGRIRRLWARIVPPRDNGSARTSSARASRLLGHPAAASETWRPLPPLLRPPPHAAAYLLCRPHGSGKAWVSAGQA